MGQAAARERAESAGFRDRGELTLPLHLYKLSGLPLLLVHAVLLTPTRTYWTRADNERKATPAGTHLCVETPCFLLCVVMRD